MPILESGTVLVGLGYDTKGIEIREKVISKDYGNNPTPITHWCGGRVGNEIEHIYHTDSAIVHFFTGQVICIACCGQVRLDEPTSEVVQR